MTTARSPSMSSLLRRRRTRADFMRVLLPSWAKGRGRRLGRWGRARGRGGRGERGPLLRLLLQCGDVELRLAFVGEAFLAPHVGLVGLGQVGWSQRGAAIDGGLDAAHPARP